MYGHETTKTHPMDLTRWRPLAYRKKIRLLWIGSAAFLVAAFRIAVLPTVESCMEYIALSQKLDASAATAGRSADMREELERFERQSAVYRTDSTRADPLLSRLAPLCGRYGVVIDALMPSVEERQESYRLITRPVRLQGDYASLVRVIHALEHQAGVGKLACVQFSLQEDMLRGRRLLYADCFVQQLREPPASEPQPSE